MTSSTSPTQRTQTASLGAKGTASAIADDAEEPALLTAESASADTLAAIAHSLIDATVRAPEDLVSALWRSPELIHQIASMTDAGFRNHVVADDSAAVELATSLNDGGAHVYVACAEYFDGESRRANNVAGASALWLDIDCGESKASSRRGYSTAEEALSALSDFARRAALPAPTHVVASGQGIHAYFVSSEFIDHDLWMTHANQLKDLTQQLGLLADPSRTSDIASVMRMPGTLNRKYDPALPVRLLSAEKPIDRGALLISIGNAHARLCSPAPSADTKKTWPNAADAFGPPDLAQLQSALATLDPDCEEHTWKLRRLAPLARAASAHPSLADALRDLAEAWSSGDLRGCPSEAWTTSTRGGKTGAEAFDGVWERFLKERAGTNETSIGTIYFDAKCNGWTFSADSHLPRPAAEAEATAIYEACIARVKNGDVGAALEPQCIEALARQNDADYARWRQGFKDANKSVSLMKVDAAVKRAKAAGNTAQTHYGYALDLVQQLTVDNVRPVAQAGRLYVVDQDTAVWKPMESCDLENLAASTYDNQPNCIRRGDYVSIAQQSIALVSDPTFFSKAPVGIACADGFYRVEKNEAMVETLTPEHRQQVLLQLSPTAMETPLFSAFLHETFKTADPFEEAQQTLLVQEIAGAIMLGLMSRYQKAVLFYEPFGRAGKGTLESILRNLVPSNFITAVSPFCWDQPYFLMSLVGSRLNVVGELPDDKPIPAAIFKSVLGCDTLTGRNPAGRPVTFRSSAAHIFMSNHLINSRDQSEAFFARWQIIEFPNSRLKSGLPLDPLLAERIVAQEMPGIAHWAIEGAKRLLCQGGFTASQAHKRLMDKWRRANSSLEEFIAECCDLDPGQHVRRSALYEHYRTWCANNTRKPFAKSRVKELLEHNIGLGVSWASLHGHEIFRGLKMKPEADWQSEDFSL